jgi:NitT/TauT family transport system substrate-binding protein
MPTVKVAVPDLVSNSYFAAIAAVELGFFESEGLNATHELIFPNFRAYEALRDGSVDFVAAPAHVLLSTFPEWRGAKLLGALSQGMFWLLVMRSDLGAVPGDVSAVKGRRIGAAPMVELGLKQLLAEAGISLDLDHVTIDRVPGTMEPGISFGVAAAKALEEGKIDGFWANAMGAENAIRSGIGTIILDVRRGLGPSSAFHYTMPVLSTSDCVISRAPETVAAALRAVVKVQRALKADPSLALKVGRKLFPSPEAELIGDVVARDLPYYDAAISEEAVLRMNQFARDVGLLKGSVPYEQVVATDFRPLWEM